MKINNKGITLVEILVAFVLFSIITVSIFSLILSNINTFNQEVTTFEITNIAVRAADVMVDKIRRATQSTITNTTSSVSFDIDTDNDGNDDIRYTYTLIDGKFYEQRMTLSNSNVLILELAPAGTDEVSVDSFVVENNSGQLHFVLTLSGGHNVIDIDRYHNIRQ